MSFYEEMREVASDLIRENGIAAVLEKGGNSHTVHAVRQSLSEQDLLKDLTAVFLIESVPGVVPEAHDRLFFFNRKYELTIVQPLAPASEALLYKAWAA